MTLVRLLRALQHFMPSLSRWALLTEDSELIHHAPTYVTDRQEFQNIIAELLPYLEILSGDILLVQGPPLLAHDGEAALVMIFPKSVAGQNLFFVERLTLDSFGSGALQPFPPLYLSRNFADDGNLLGELEGILPARSLEALSASFHHLLWTQLKVLDLFAQGSLKKISTGEVGKFWARHREALAPYFEEMLEQTVFLEKPWAPERSLRVEIEKKKDTLTFDFSKSQWPKEWQMSGEFLKDLIPQVLRHHLYADLAGTHAENDFFKVKFPQLAESAQGERTLPPVVVAPLLCDFLSEALQPWIAESGGASSAFGALSFRLDFTGGDTFQHLLFGGGGARPFSHGEAGYNPWLPGFETLSFQKSLVPLPLQIIKLGKRGDSGGQGPSRGGEGLEWIFNLKEPAKLTAYTFQGIWPARGLKSPNSGKKAQILIGKEDVLGKKIQIQHDIPKGSVLALRTAGGAGLG